jgi:hypothetical protein
MPRLRPPKSTGGQPPNGDQAAAAAYVAALVADLAGIARRHKLDTLGFLLDMAGLEAEEVTRGAASSRPSGEGHQPAALPRHAAGKL